jgi:hypothetical protein
VPSTSGGGEQQLHIAELAGYCVGAYIHAADDYVLRSLDTGRFVRDEVLNDPTEAFAEVSQTLFGKRPEEFFGSTRHSWPWTPIPCFTASAWPTPRRTLPEIAFWVASSEE